MSAPGEPRATPGPTPPAPGVVPSRLRRLALRAFMAGARVSLWFSPRPMAAIVRRDFAKGGAETKAILDRHAPAATVTMPDERYGPGTDELLDVHVSAATVDSGGSRPAVVWIHGGGFVGGTKEEIGGYLRLLTDHGYTGVSVRYSLAPGATYPTPVRQVLAALAYLCTEAERLHIDPRQLFLAGDSAGAQIAAQVATIVTNPDYARTLGVDATITPAQLRAVGLCCGIYDPMEFTGKGAFGPLVTTIVWSYSGVRNWRNSPLAATIDLLDRITPEYPPAFLTVGNADPLTPQSERLVDALRARGVEVETLFYPPDHEPALPHEYQFDLDLADARTAFDRLVEFFGRHRLPSEHSEGE